MTTFDDADAFGETFGTFRHVDVARRHSAWLTVVALVVAAVVVGGGLAWLRDAGGLARPAATAERLDATTLLTVFAEPQTSADVVAADDLAGLRLDASTTRMLAVTGASEQFAVVNTSGDLCLLTTTTGELPALTCTPARHGATVANAEVTLVTDGGPAPAAAEGWREAGPQVFVRD